MGREAEAQVTFCGQSAAGKVLLEAEELVLRGAIKAQLLRADLTGFAVEGDDLLMLTPLGALRLTLGAAQAGLWLKALQKPAPSLAAKLGISPQSPACVIGDLSDAALMAALQGCISADALLFVAELPDQAAFEAALAVIARLPQARFWGVTRKGAAQGFSEADLRAQMRAAGFIDSKSCAVSALHSATRYGRPR